MKKYLLAVLMFGFIGTASAHTVTPHVDHLASGNAATSLGVVVAAVTVVAMAAIEQNDYTCEIVKTAPKPGTNYTNQKSICTK